VHGRHDRIQAAWIENVKNARDANGSPAWPDAQNFWWVSACREQLQPPAFTCSIGCNPDHRRSTPGCTFRHFDPDDVKRVFDSLSDEQKVQLGLQPPSRTHHHPSPSLVHLRHSQQRPTEPSIKLAERPPVVPVGPVRRVGSAPNPTRPHPTPPHVLPAGASGPHVHPCQSHLVEAPAAGVRYGGPIGSVGSASATAASHLHSFAVGSSAYEGAYGGKRETGDEGKREMANPGGSPYVGWSPFGASSILVSTPPQPVTGSTSGVAAASRPPFVSLPPASSESQTDPDPYLAASPFR